MTQYPYVLFCSTANGYASVRGYETYLEARRSAAFHDEAVPDSRTMIPYTRDSGRTWTDVTHWHRPGDAPRPLLRGLAAVKADRVRHFRIGREAEQSSRPPGLREAEAAARVEALDIEVDWLEWDNAPSAEVLYAEIASLPARLGTAAEPYGNILEEFTRTYAATIAEQLNEGRYWISVPSAITGLDATFSAHVARRLLESLGLRHPATATSYILSHPLAGPLGWTTRRPADGDTLNAAQRS